ncbi:MAG: hypothetical protein EOL93_12140 [Epsilonproteobacteria bacterium]|nr:hypothetical protein [Campylobacterota bacterium]
MVHKHQPIEINMSDDIFQNDKLERKNAIKDLSALLASTNQSFVLALNADWGDGKTTFVKLWQAYLQKEKGMRSIYFSAWEDDFSKEPLISILGEIKKYINDNFSEKSDVAQSFEKVKSFSGKVLKRGVPAFVKGMMGGVLDVPKGVEEAIGAITESTAKELIENYSKDKEITKEFKKAIQELFSKIDEQKPFVVFIDELDRCRPLYAIELLERIKHIFGIDGLIFVLSIDKKQLVESIKSQYGNIDAQTYLRRFLDMEYNLQNANLDEFCTYLYYDIYKLNEALKAKGIKRELLTDLDELVMIKYLARSANLSLRDIEQVFTRLKIIFNTTELGFFEVHFRIIVLFVVLKMRYSDKYDLLLAKKIKEEDFMDIFLSYGANDETKDLEVFIKAIFLSTKKSEEEMNQIIETHNEPQSFLVRLLKANYGNFHREYRLNKVIDSVIQKVEFTNKFNFETTK